MSRKSRREDRGKKSGAKGVLKIGMALGIMACLYAFQAFHAGALSPARVLLFMREVPQVEQQLSGNTNQSSNGTEDASAVGANSSLGTSKLISQAEQVVEKAAVANISMEAFFASASESTNDDVKCADSSTKKLCQSVYKLAVKHGVHSLLDASCGLNADWMPEVVQQLSTLGLTFHFICLSKDSQEQQVLKDKFENLHNVDVIVAKWWATELPGKIDMVLMWDELSHVMYSKAWAFLSAVKKSQAKLLVLDNYPTVNNEASTSKQHLNVRRHPFSLPSAKETIYDVTEAGDTKSRQLVLYDVENLPKALLD
eukprot:Plantae.Rhodophyta-Purpureofilum_apyrenoidigerum.ctg232.p1 GENE.Plantae.Rhodophyta-Purpureofilum_apyrenoidigerum.ctg232~~Plantae.Rhodophyta-Purpureofilum_apyrenoidigerum.ctg232.p1  ORF type:complete len:312 (-),score=53.88 Plantae.Rhodophyta-Purpureofilum_apyrenoidigerum.ctg232:6-941(-)